MFNYGFPSYGGGMNAMGNMIAPMPGIGMQPLGSAGMAPQMPSQASQAPQGVNSQPGYICRPVASYDEAKAVPTDYMGNIILMPDFAHGMIYAKALDANTGNPIFQRFRFSPEQPDISMVGGYDPRPDLDRLRQDVAALRAELDELKETPSRRQASKVGGSE